MSTLGLTHPLASDQFRSLTYRARKALQLANQEAQRLNHDYIGTEHLLLGLVKDGFGVGAQVLTDMGVEFTELRRHVQKIAPMNPHQSTIGRLPSNDEVYAVLRSAAEKAKSFNCAQVGTGHILLGLISSKDTPFQKVIS